MPAPFSFGAPATASAGPAPFSFGAPPPSGGGFTFAPVAGGGGDDAGEGGGDDNDGGPVLAENPSDKLPTEAVPGSGIGAGLIVGESVLFEVRAQVHRLGTDKAWKDLGVGTFFVVGGGVGGARAAFAPPNAIRPLLRCALAPAVTAATIAPTPASGKPGGVQLTAMTEVAGVWQLTRMLIKTKTQGVQNETLAAVLSVAGKTAAKAE